MKVNKSLSGLLIALCSVSLCSFSLASVEGAKAPASVTASTATDSRSANQTTKVVAAANTFLATLSDAQKKAVLFDWTDDAQRAHWSPLPEGFFNRAGVRWGELNAEQRGALMELLGTVLSTDGLEMVKNQMNADDVWKATGGTLNVPPSTAALAFSNDLPPVGPPGGGQPPAGGPRNAGSGSGGPGGSLPETNFGSDYYSVSFVGTPSTTSPWTLQYGGHHLGINATVVGPNLTLAPSLTGGEPIRATVMGKTFMVVPQVPREMKDAFAMLGSLNAEQRSRAVISTQRIDLVLGPGHDNQTLQPEGLPGSAMSASQKTQLLALIEDRLGALNAEALAPKLKVIEKNLNETYFAWYGPTSAGSAAYYRVTGPSVIIEFSPQTLGNDPANHLHSLYRDPTNDYGAAWTK